MYPIGSKHAEDKKHYKLYINLENFAFHLSVLHKYITIHDAKNIKEVKIYSVNTRG